MTSDDPSTDKENSTTDDPSTDEETSTTDDPSTDEETSTTDEGDNTTIMYIHVFTQDQKKFYECEFL